MKYKVAIVDDHTLIASALRDIITKFANFKVIFICENGRDLQEKLKIEKTPDLILLDIGMPVMDGFQTATWLKEHYPSIKIMVLSMQDDEQSLLKMIKKGARGYLVKNTNPHQLRSGMESLMVKGSFFPEWATDKIITSIQENQLSAVSRIALSERELEFLKYTVTEMTYKEIADKMNCSPRTVENYRDSLFEKLETKSRIGLAMYAIKNGYVPL
ncbi:response regulator [Flavobacteriaceae bacterium M23B6Z8]